MESNIKEYKIPEIFNICPNCGSRRCGLTNPDDGVSVCSRCGYHVCVHSEHHKCFVNIAYRICTPECCFEKLYYSNYNLNDIVNSRLCMVEATEKDYVPKSLLNVLKHMCYYCSDDKCNPLRSEDRRKCKTYIKWLKKNKKGWMRRK